MNHCLSQTYAVVQWLISATIQLLTDRYIYISCSVTESTPVAKCLATLNCTKCNEVTTEVFTSHILLPVTAGSDYHISVQAVRPDNNETLEEYSIVKTLLVLELSPELMTTIQPPSTLHLQPTLQPQSMVQTHPTLQPYPTPHPNSGASCKSYKF